MKPRFFATPTAFRAWLERHHAERDELLVGFRRKGSGRPSITWPESVDEALCFGWIDGIRRRLDDESYTIRFTPRREGSTWSRVNVGRAEALIAEGRMRPAGRQAFEKRTEENTGRYSFEQEGGGELPAEYRRELRADPRAWEFFSAQPPGYRRTASFWVMSAKREETRRRRLAQLVGDSAAGLRIAPLRRTGG